MRISELHNWLFSFVGGWNDSAPCAERESVEFLVLIGVSMKIKD